MPNMPSIQNMQHIQNIQDLRDNYSVLDDNNYSDGEVVQWIASQTGETTQEVATYLGFSGRKSTTNSTPKDAYVTMSDRGLASTNSQEGSMTSGQFFIEMIVGAFVLMMIIKISKIHDLSFKFSVTDYASTMFDHDVYVSGKRNFIHILLGFLTSYFVLFFLPKDGILKVLPIIIIAITAWLVAVLPLNIAKEKKIIVNNKQQNIWLIYCFLAWPIALIHSIIGKKIQPENNKDKKCDHELFHGGDGLSKNSPVSINCASMEVAKSNMDIFIRDNCGDDCKRTDLEYTIANPNDSEKLIKVIPVTKPDGTTMKFFFDLSRQVNNFTNMVKMFGDKD